MKQHQLKHSDYKQFCCGSCGKYFKHKENVVRHVKRCFVKLGYVHIFARQDWHWLRTNNLWTVLLHVGQSCYCWLKTCQWGHSVYPVVGDSIVVVFRLVSVVVDCILVWAGLLDLSLAPQSGGFVKLCLRLHKLEPSIPNVVCVDFVHVGEIPAGESMTELSSLARMVWGCPTRCFRLTVIDKSFIRLLCSPCSSSCCSKPLVLTVATAVTSGVVGYNF